MLSPRKFKVSVEQLRDMYVNQGMTQEAIGKALGVHQGTVGDWLRFSGIKPRDSGPPPSVVLPKDELRDLYITQGYTMRQLRKHYGCGAGTITRNIRDYGLQMDEQQKRKALLKRNKSKYSYRTEHRGYTMVRMPDHPWASKSGYVGEHRLVAEKAVGRILEPHEEVHHLDLRTRNNAIENLAVLSKNQHTAVHKYLNRVAVYLTNVSPVRPEALDFGAPVFWGGKYVTSVDLIQEAINANRLRVELPSGDGIAVDKKDLIN